MRSMLYSGWVGLALSAAAAPPPPVWPGPPGPEVARARVVIDRPGRHFFPAVVRRVGSIPWTVREYGDPALSVRADGVRVRGFAWRGSMEGVNVGSADFSPRGMRSRHRPIRVVLEKLWCDDIGEDAVSIQPRAVVTLRDGVFRGNHRLLPSDDGEVRGLDKIIQIDGAEVTLENCTFFNGVSAIRGKANSRIVLKNCRFINCSTCLSGDGQPNPRPSNPYDAGQSGRCLITAIDCEAWQCGLFAGAHPGCEIRLVDCRVHDTRLRREHGGRIRLYRRAAKGQVLPE